MIPDPAYRMSSGGLAGTRQENDTSDGRREILEALYDT